MKTMSVKEVVALLNERAKAYVESLNPYEKKELAVNYKKKVKRTNGISLVVFSLLVVACLAISNILSLAYGFGMVVAVPFATLGVIFLALAIYSKAQMSKVDKMTDEEATLNGAIQYIQKITSFEELRAIMTGNTSIANTNLPDNNTVADTNGIIGSDSAPPETTVSESISGKESEGEGEKLEGELTRQKFSIEGKSATELLTELKGLYEAGLITEADYENKKAEILEKL